MVCRIEEAAARGARVAVFPETALRAPSGTPQEEVVAGVEAIRHAARANNLYVVFGGWSWSEIHRKNVNWMKVIAPDGAELIHYDKLWDAHGAPAPSVFSLDGVPASAIICADRWLRAVEDLPIQLGAQISFELSDNFDVEWAPELEWYWYVPRALRNSVWVVFANTANSPPDHEAPLRDDGPRHGHSAIIAPDGSITAAARDDRETILVADLEMARATRAEATARSEHTALGGFWRAGREMLLGGNLTGPPLETKECPTVELTVAAAQIAETPDPARNATLIAEQIGEAARRGADLIAFPELALTGGQLIESPGAVDRISASAREHRVTVVVGAPWRANDGWRNSALVIGPDGEVLTRYDQLAAAAPFSGGDRPASMWFAVKGTPAVVTIGRDALWNEMAELAAVAGARVHVNIAREPAPGSEAILRRRQIGAAAASFRTITVMANGGGYSAIWDDLTGAEEARAVVRAREAPRTGLVKIYSPFSANLVAEAGASPGLILAKRRVSGRNPHFEARLARFHPATAPWYALGAAILLNQPEERKGPSNPPIEAR